MRVLASRRVGCADAAKSPTPVAFGDSTLPMKRKEEDEGNYAAAALR
jgi:hypothetical protein